MSQHGVREVSFQNQPLKTEVNKQNRTEVTRVIHAEVKTSVLNGEPHMNKLVNHPRYTGMNDLPKMVFTIPRVMVRKAGPLIRSFLSEIYTIHNYF